MNVEIGRGLLDFKDLTHFWKLPVVSLTLKNGDMWFDDSDLRKLAISFPRLRFLDLEHDSLITNQGLAAMASLKELRVLKINVGGNISHGIRGLAECERLQKLSLILHCFLVI